MDPLLSLHPDHNTMGRKTSKKTYGWQGEEEAENVSTTRNFARDFCEQKPACKSHLAIFVTSQTQPSLLTTTGQDIMEAYFTNCHCYTPSPKELYNI